MCRGEETGALEATMERRKVNARQLEVLAWIANKCPDGVMLDSSYKTTTVALRSRGLATLSKRGGWHAGVTDVGRHYLEHGNYPDDAGSTRPSVRAVPAPPKPAAKPKTPRSIPVPADLKPATPEPTPEPETPPHAVPVPEHLRNPHRVVAALRDGKRQIATPASLRKRVLRIIQALAIAAEELGWTVQPVGESRTTWGHPWNSDDLVVISTGETCEGVRLIQENDRTPHAPTARELAQKKSWSYTRIPEYDYTPSTRLRIELATNWDGRRHTWGDRQRWTLDDKLGQVIDEIEVRSCAAREKRVEREAEEAERRRRRDVAIDNAKVGLRDSHRAKVLLSEIQDWRTANELRAYLDAMESRIAQLPDPDVAHALMWLEWCREYSRGLDPLERTIGMPADPEPTDEALRPFLR